MADSRKTLPVLAEEWTGCVKCGLGSRREAANGVQLFGDGVLGGVMFICDAPGKEDESSGRLCSGKGSSLVKTVLSKIGFHDYYLTSLVSCRSCELLIDQNTQLPKVSRSYPGRPGGPVYRDRPPLVSEIEACLPRLYEEIYIVDPVLIVALGPLVASALTKQHITITRQRGDTVECSIPGATMRPVLTDTRQAWGRKIRGSYRLPTEQNEVKYDLLIMSHPDFVENNGNDLGKNSPVAQFASDIRTAVKIYKRYLVEALDIQQ